MFFFFFSLCPCCRELEGLSKKLVGVLERWGCHLPGFWRRIPKYSLGSELRNASCVESWAGGVPGIAGGGKQQGLLGDATAPLCEWINVVVLLLSSW